MEEFQKLFDKVYGVFVKDALHHEDRNTLIISAPKIQEFN